MSLSPELLSKGIQYSNLREVPQGIYIQEVGIGSGDVALVQRSRGMIERVGGPLSAQKPDSSIHPSLVIEVKPAQDRITGQKDIRTFVVFPAGVNPFSLPRGNGRRV